MSVSTPRLTWTEYYDALIERHGFRAAERARTRLYGRLESLHAEADELENLRESWPHAPAGWGPWVESHLETIEDLARRTSIQLEAVIEALAARPVPPC
jgi:hypothetical protein